MITEIQKRIPRSSSEQLNNMTGARPHPLGLIFAQPLILVAWLSSDCTFYQSAASPSLAASAQTRKPTNANMNTSMATTAAAASAKIHLGSALLVFSTQQLDPDSGSQKTHVLQKSVAAMVSGGARFGQMFFSSILNTLYHRQCYLTKLPWPISKQPRYN